MVQYFITLPSAIRMWFLTNRVLLVTKCLQCESFLWLSENMFLLEDFCSIFHLFISYSPENKFVTVHFKSKHYTNSEKVLYSKDEILLDIVQCQGWEEGEILMLFDEYIFICAASMYDWTHKNNPAPQMMQLYLLRGLNRQSWILFYFKLALICCKSNTNIFI